MERILVVNVNWVGDVIFSAPVFHALKVTYPNAQIACLAVPRVREILESIPEIDEIIVYDEKGDDRSPLAKLKLIFQLRRKRFNIAFLLHRSLTRALFVYFAGIPKRVGYDTKDRGRYLTHIVEHLEEEGHRSDHYLNIIESCGIEVKDRQCRLQVTPNAQKDMTDILKSKNIEDRDYLIVVNSGGNWDLKRWPLEYFARLTRALKNIPGVKIVLTGAPKDVTLNRKITTLSLNETIDLTGQTSIKQLIALMKRANLVISADSGPLHLANGVGSDVIGIYGPTRPEITGPRGSGQAYVVQQDVGCNREPCYHLRCPDNICMQSVTVEHVFKIVQQIRNS